MREEEGEQGWMTLPGWLEEHSEDTQ